MVRLLRIARRRQEIFGEFMRCPRGHRVPGFNVVRCSCGVTFEEYSSGYVRLQAARRLHPMSHLRFDRPQPRPMSRPARTKGIQLTARDDAVLRVVARMRAIRTGDVVRLVFPAAFDVTPPFAVSVGCARAGFSKARPRWVRHRAHPRASGADVGPGHRVDVGSVPSGRRTHHLVTVSAWAGLATDLHRTGAAAIDLVRAEWEIREHPDSRSALLVPDLLVQLRLVDGRIVRLAVELDRGTERPPTLWRKLQAYEACRHDPAGLFGWVDFTLVMVLEHPGPARRRTLERIVSDWSGTSLV